MRRLLVTFVLAGSAFGWSACTLEPPSSARGRARALGSDGSDIVQGTAKSDPAPGTTPAAVDAVLPGGGTVTPVSVSPGAEVLGPVTQGVATFYDADGTGNCGFPASPQDLMVVAPNKDRYYDGSAICGACMRVTGAQGSVIVRVVDSCPVNQIEGDCGQSGADLDLSAQAFAAIDDPDKGIVDITFQVIPCDVTGPMTFRFKSGSSQSWTAIQIGNHRLPVAKVEYSSNNQWIAMAREDDDFFIAPSGVGPRPSGLPLRVTSSTGEVVQQTLPGIQSGKTLTGTVQF